MHISNTIFTEAEFWALIAFSVILPFLIYWRLLSKRAIAQSTILLLGLALVAIAGVDVYLLQRLAVLVKLSRSLSDDAIFLSELSLALYFLPALFGGIGINLVSHVLLKHLAQAEKRFENANSDS